MGNIKLVFEGYCKGCKVADVEVYSLFGYAFDGSEIAGWEVRCKHEEACRTWRAEKKSKSKPS